MMPQRTLKLKENKNPLLVKQFRTRHSKKLNWQFSSLNHKFQNVAYREREHAVEILIVAKALIYKQTAS